MDGTNRGGGTTRALAWLLGAAVVGGCASTPYLGTTAASFMRRVKEERDPNLRHLAYGKLASAACYDNDQQKVEATRLLSLKLAEGREPAVTRALICRTLGEIGRPEAREALLKAIDDQEPLIREAACRALGKVGTPADTVVLARVMSADSDPDCRIAAIEGIRNFREPDPRVEIVLVDALENPDPAIRLAAYEALQVITGLDLGPDAKAWRGRSRPIPTPGEGPAVAEDPGRDEAGGPAARTASGRPDAPRDRPS
jgi:hypothetical protein